MRVLKIPWEMDPSKVLLLLGRFEVTFYCNENWHFTAKMAEKVRKAGFCNFMYKRFGFVFMLDLMIFEILGDPSIWIQIQIRLKMRRRLHYAGTQTLFETFATSELERFCENRSHWGNLALSGLQF